jgi:hypothetical protein
MTIILGMVGGILLTGLIYGLLVMALMDSIMDAVEREK